MEWDEARSLLESLFPMPGTRLPKCAALFEYAQRNQNGCIVELGTGEGCGAIALALGACPRTRVFTIDDFAVRKGWAQEPYGPENEDICLENFRKAGVDVTLVKDRADLAHKDWYEPIGLLYWDLGMFSGMARDFGNWEPLVLKGGHLLLHDTGDRKLGSKVVEQRAVQSRRFRRPGHVGGGLWAFEKRPNVVCCAGMSRSGGTLQYYITKGIVENAGIGRGIGHGFGHGSAVLEVRPELLVFKAENPRSWILEMVDEEQIDVVGMFRDPRDVAASLVEWVTERKKYRPPDADWQQFTRTALRWQKQWEEVEGTYMARYENYHPAGWVDMALEIADFLAIALDRNDAETIVAQCSIEKQRERIAQMGPKEWFSMKTLLTHAHIGKEGGKIGRYLQDLSTDDIRYVEDIATCEWMAAHGYRLLDR